MLSTWLRACQLQRVPFIHSWSTQRLYNSSDVYPPTSYRRTQGSAFSPQLERVLHLRRSLALHTRSERTGTQKCQSPPYHTTHPCKSAYWVNILLMRKESWTSHTAVNHVATARGVGGIGSVRCRKPKLASNKTAPEPNILYCKLLECMPLM